MEAYGHDIKWKADKWCLQYQYQYLTNFQWCYINISYYLQHMWQVFLLKQNSYTMFFMLNSEHLWKIRSSKEHFLMLLLIKIFIFQQKKKCSQIHVIRKDMIVILFFGEQAWKSVIYIFYYFYKFAKISYQSSIMMHHVHCTIDWGCLYKNIVNILENQPEFKK